MSWTWPRIERRTVLVMFGAALVVGLWLGNTAWLALRADDEAVPWSRPYLWEVTGVLSAFVWSWIPCATARNAPRPAGRWSRFLAIHTAGYASFAGLHTALMIGSRVALYPVLGWGSYEYGGPGGIWLRLSMEWHKDLVAYLAFAVGFGLITSWRDSQRRALREAQLATELRDAQLRALVGQLNPHFLFNALNTISAVMYTDLARTDRLLADLGQMLRAGLLDHTRATWSVAEERAHTERFLSIMLARFGDRLRVDWRADERASAAQVPRFSLQLLVENAIKHNQDARGPLAIAISTRRVDDRVEIEVVDDGRGFEPGPSAGPGTGLATLRRALELCHGSGSALELECAPEGGARVRLTVPAGRAT